MMDLGSVLQYSLSMSQVPSSFSSAKRDIAGQICCEILQDSVFDVEGRSNPHASARSATDEWLMGLEGRWQCRLNHTKSHRLMVILLPSTFHSSFFYCSSYLYLFPALSSTEWIAWHLEKYAFTPRKKNEKINTTLTFVCKVCSYKPGDSWLSLAYLGRLYLFSLIHRKNDNLSPK